MVSQWNALIHIKYIVSTYSVLTILVTHKSPVLAKFGGCTFSATAEDLIDEGYWAGERIAIFFHGTQLGRGTARTQSEPHLFLTSAHFPLLTTAPLPSLCSTNMCCTRCNKRGNSLILVLFPPLAETSSFIAEHFIACMTDPMLILGISITP